MIFTRYLPQYPQLKDIMNQLKNVIVTGSNKGIGYGIVEYLASKPGWNIIMAVRNVELGLKAKEQILLKHPHAHIHLEKLDVSNTQSIEAFIPLIKNKYESIDVLVNNAGVAAKGDAFDTEVLKFTFGTNFYGTIELSEKLLPLIKNNGKIVSLGSTAGTMSFKKITNEELKAKFTNPNITREDLFGLVHKFQAQVADNTFQQKGWPKWSYGISKLAINVYHKILGHREDVLQKNIQVYVCCPGFVKTDMSSHKGHLTVDQGIKTPVYLIEKQFAINKEQQGGMFYLQKLISPFGQ